MSSTDRATYWGPNTQFAIKTFPEQRAIAEQRGWKVDGQEETCPSTGRKHIQFWVKTPQVRMSVVKKVFSGAHIEVARNVEAVKQYCKKEDTRTGDIPQASDKYPNQDKLFALFGGWIRTLPPSKNRWLYTDDGYRRQNVQGDVWLLQFDECCSALIMNGYRVESLAVNPAVRSAIKKFGNAIFARFVNERDAEAISRCAEDRQTDRQAEIISVPVYIPSEDATRREDTESASRTDAETSASEDFEDDISTASERHTQSTDADCSEASHSSGDSE